jgi:hypothetical protein
MATNDRAATAMATLWGGSWQLQIPHGVAANTFSLGVTTPPLITLSFSFLFLIYFKDFFN